jgi:hypothetical protein
MHFEPPLTRKVLIYLDWPAEAYTVKRRNRLLTAKRSCLTAREQFESNIMIARRHVLSTYRKGYEVNVKRTKTVG